MGTNRRHGQAARTCHTVFSCFDLQPWPMWIVILKSIKFISIRVSGLDQSHIFHGRKTDYKNSHLCSDCANETFFFRNSGDTVGEGKNEVSFVLKVKTQLEGKRDTLMRYYLQRISFLIIELSLACSCLLHNVPP